MICHNPTCGQTVPHNHGDLCRITCGYCNATTQEERMRLTQDTRSILDILPPYPSTSSSAQPIII